MIQLYIVKLNNLISLSVQLIIKRSLFLLKLPNLLHRCVRLPQLLHFGYVVFFWDLQIH